MSSYTDGGKVQQLASAANKSLQLGAKLRHRCIGIYRDLCLIGVQVFFQVNTQLLSDVLQLLQVGGVLLFVFHLVFQGLEGSDGSWVVVDSSTSLQCFFNDDRGRDQVVGETVVQDSLDLEEIVCVFELLFVSELVGKRKERRAVVVLRGSEERWSKFWAA